MKKSKLIQEIGIEVLSLVNEYKKGSIKHPLSKQFWNEEDEYINQGQVLAAEAIHSKLYDLLNKRWNDSLKEERD